MSKTQRHVTRATFASELFGGTDAIDQGKILQLSLHEVSVGPGSLTHLKALSERGCLNVALILILDAMSVVAAVAAPTIKTPAENGLLLHLKWVREQLDTNQLWAICWVDTRSMAADGMTKGAIAEALKHNTADIRVPTPAEQLAIQHRHSAALHDFYGDYLGPRIVRKHHAWFLESLHKQSVLTVDTAKALRSDFNTLATPQAQLDRLEVYTALLAVPHERAPGARQIASCGVNEAPLAA